MGLSELFNKIMPRQAPAMGGMAGQAQQALIAAPYQQYVQEMQALGQQPLPMPQWQMMMQQKAQQAAQPAATMPQPGGNPAGIQF